MCRRFELISSIDGGWRKPGRHWRNLADEDGQGIEDPLHGAATAAATSPYRHQCCLRGVLHRLEATKSDTNFSSGIEDRRIIPKAILQLFQCS